MAPRASPTHPILARRLEAASALARQLRQLADALEAAPYGDAAARDLVYDNLDCRGQLRFGLPDELRDVLFGTDQDAPWR